MGKKSIWIALALIIATSALMVSAPSFFRGKSSHATELARVQLEELHKRDLTEIKENDRAEPEVSDLFEHVLNQFYRTQDASYLQPDTGIGILHLACLFKKAELVRCLLLDGADPNAQAPGADSPLLMAVATWPTPQTSTQQITAIVDTLLAAGADFSKSSASEGDFLTQAAQLCEDEQALLYLIEKGAQPDADTAVPLALHGWSQALKAVLTRHPQQAGLMSTAAQGAALYTGDHIACMELLSARGASTNEAADETQPNTTPLYCLAREMASMDEHAPHRSQAIRAFLWLLDHGADALRREENDPEYPGFCPYDFIAMNPDLLTELKAQGAALEAPQLSFGKGSTLLPDICRAAMAPHPTEQLAPHAEDISAVLAPTAEMLRHELYPQALPAAVSMLAQIDPVHAAQRILHSPIWMHPTPATDREEAQDALSALVRALQDDTRLVLPQNFICEQAEKLFHLRRADDAAGLIELLGRCEGAQDTIERYCTDARLPLQAGAYAARLYSAGLPDARNNGVASWLIERGKQANTEFLQESVLLTSLEKLWYGQMPAQEQQQLLELMRRIGATKAASAYEQIINALDKPDELDALLARGDEWMYELEAATARHFLQHQAEFLSKTP